MRMIESKNIIFYTDQIFRVDIFFSFDFLESNTLASNLFTLLKSLAQLNVSITQCLSPQYDNDTSPSLVCGDFKGSGRPNLS